MRRLVAGYWLLVAPEKEFREAVKHLKPESVKRYERDRNWLFKQPSKVHIYYQKKSRKARRKAKKPKAPYSIPSVPPKRKTKERKITHYTLMKNREYKKSQLYAFMSEVGKKAVHYQRRGVFYSITAHAKTDVFEGYVRTKIFSNMSALLGSAERRFRELFSQPSVKTIYFYWVRLYLIPKDYSYRKRK